MKIRRDPESSKEEFLYFLYNNCGYKELAVAYNYWDKRDSCLKFSKWIFFEALMHLGPEDMVIGLPIFISKKKFMERVSHRTLAPGEIILDIDDCKWRNGYVFPTTEAKMRRIVMELKELGFDPVVYATGGKGYHLSLFDNDIAKQDKRERAESKRQIMEHYFCDGMKASERTMISLEGSLHFKSGKIKSEVKLENAGK